MRFCITSVLLIVAAIALSGCLAAALAPMGFQVVQTLGVSAGNAVTGRDPASDDEGENLACEELVKAAPYVDEVRFESDGAPRVRQWVIASGDEGARWQVVSSADGDAKGWHVGAHLQQMDFQPPLASAVTSSGGKYLVSAPIDPINSHESDQLLSFTALFAPGVGTYRFNGKRYMYVVAKKLPCLPIHPGSLQADSTQSSIR